MMYMSKADADRREMLVFGRKYDPANYRMGGIASFDHMSAKTARELITIGLMDPEETQEGSPTNEEFVSFVEGCDDPEEWFIHGYVVSPERDDCRINIEGVGAYCEVSVDELLEFVKAFRNADELVASPDSLPYCWYD